MTVASAAYPLDGASEPRRAWHPALGLVPVALVTAVAGVVAGGSRPGGGWILAALNTLAWIVAGGLVASRRPLCRLGIVLLTGTAVASLGLAAAAVGASWTGGGGTAALSVHGAAVTLLPAFGLHLLLGLPRGALSSAWRRGAVVSGYFVAGAGAAAAARDGHPSPLVVSGLAAIMVVVGAPASHAAYLGATGIERQRLQWLGCGVAVALETALVVGALRALLGWPGRPWLVMAAGALAVPLSFAVATWPRAAARVDMALVQTVSVAGLTAVTAGVYLLVVVGLGRVPRGADRNLMALSMLAAAVAAGLYGPARRRLAEQANRLVYGERHAPDDVLRSFGSRLSRSVPMDELLLQLAESLRKTMALRRAEVWTGTPELLERTVSLPYADPVQLAVGALERAVVSRAGASGPAWVSVWLPALLDGREPAQTRVAPVVHSGELLGLLVVEREADGEVFTDEDDRVLVELARQVGLALHNVQLDSALQATLDVVRRTNDELRVSRARIVAAGDAERRKIERNIHDGAQQQLVALAVNLRLAKDIIADDPHEAAEMLDALAVDVRDTITDVRNLAHGIFPPLLVDSGLADALRAAANRSTLGVATTIEGVGRHSTDIEAAVYFCCLEALQNAAKHAPGSSVALRVWEEQGGLLFEVADDGGGFAVTPQVLAGHGYTNMADRLGAIGGTVRWESAPGTGTTVHGAIPIAEGSPAG